MRLAMLVLPPQLRRVAATTVQLMQRRRHKTIRMEQHGGAIAIVGIITRVGMPGGAITRSGKAQAISQGLPQLRQTRPTGAAPILASRRHQNRHRTTRLRLGSCCTHYNVRLARLSHHQYHQHHQHRSLCQHALRRLRSRLCRRAATPVQYPLLTHAQHLVLLPQAQYPLLPHAQHLPLLFPQLRELLVEARHRAVSCR